MMRKKKNDESEQPVNTTPVKAAPVSQKNSQEPEIKVTQKPTLAIDQLKIKSSFSIVEARASNGKTQSGNVTKEQTATVEFANKEVTEEDVKGAIFVYADNKMKSGSRQIATTLTMAAISFKENIITLTINNETQREILQNIKQDFLDAIRSKLHNNTISLNLEISEQPVQTKAYKPADIFKQMAEKNPALLELKKRFDLEIDY